ncbi:Hypothetical Protein FCC1311_002142 [Hondaea fermentalgiana]|uniref:Uncharacterized protein n=1 Tax=Hondaea fermentalgiana TaxID=2315210 RepID=A0A2R5FZ14_9STRA|nr:Hypothetical Protein FCC1311_002142 [Hondaea fermentalgiana]|eukprot:GBG23996.1 Hypothetical Protein FCC1311_002142 [Hondaea fermentalgiana]
MATNTIDTKKIDNATGIPVAAFVEEPRPVSPQPQQIQYVPGSDPRVAMRGGYCGPISWIICCAFCAPWYREVYISPPDGRRIQPGGQYDREKYCGPMTWIIGLFVCPCVCCCPCDEREVYYSPPDGRRIVLG